MLTFLTSTVETTGTTFADLFAFLGSGYFWAFLGVFLAVALSGIGSAKGVRMVGEAATGMISENPSLFGKLIMLEALPGTQGIYGLLIGFVTCLQLGLFNAELREITLVQGILLCVACLPIAFVGLFSAQYQARVAASAVNILVKRPNEVVKGVSLAAMVETYAVLALLISFLMVSFILK